jgi:hypothetical protein
VNVLRDLPGVQRVTDLTRGPRNFEYLSFIGTMNEIEGVSVKLFGTCDRFQRWIDEEGDDPDEKAEWERNFAVTQLPWSESRPFWEAIGWDISDGRDEELISAHWFMRSIIVTARGLDEEAKFTPNATGKWPDQDDDLDLAERLQAEAEIFMKRRR